MTATQHRETFERLIAELDDYLDRQPPLPQYRARGVSTVVPLVDLEELARASAQFAA